MATLSEGASVADIGEAAAFCERRRDCYLDVIAGELETGDPDGELVLFCAQEAHRWELRQWAVESCVHAWFGQGVA